MRVRDVLGRDWAVEVPFLPWRRVIQPFGIAFECRRRHKVVRGGQRVDTRTRTQRRLDENDLRPSKDEELKGWQTVLVVVVVVVGIPELIIEVLARALLVLFLVPFAAGEMLAQVVVGTVLWVRRTLGSMPSRLEVIGYDGREIRSLSVFDVPGREAARRLSGELAGRLAMSAGPFVPSKEPIVRAAEARKLSHASAW